MATADSLGISTSTSSSTSSSITGQLDVQWIVEQMIEAKKQPIRDMEPYQELYKAQKNAYQELNTYLSSLERSLYDLGNTGFSAKSATISDTDVLTATASRGAQSGTYAIRVGQLAQAQTATTDETFSSATQNLLDSGTFTLTQGSETLSVDLTLDPQSLNGLRDKINASDLDVTASVVNYGTSSSPQYRLQVFSNEVGTDAAFTVGGTTTDLTLTNRLDAQNAQIYINDFTNPIERQSNTIDDVLSGITFNLRKAQPGETVTLNVTEDVSGLKDKINAFVESYNTATPFLDEQFRYDEEKGAAGVLSGQYSARKAQLDLLGLASGRISGASDDAAYKTLSQIGITIDRDGLLEVNDEMLDEAINQHYDEVRSLFTDMGTTSNTNIRFLAAGAHSTPGTYEVNITRLGEQALVAAGTDMAATLASDEVLTFSLGSASGTVSLTSGMSSAQALTSINNQLDSLGLGITAELNSGRLQFRSDAYGSSQTLSVYSDQAAGSGGTGVGTDTLSDQGVDVAGTIGGLAATGSGRTLTGSQGATEGVTLSVQASTLGSQGTLTLTKGPG